MIPDRWSLKVDKETDVPVVTVRDKITYDDFRQFQSAVRNVPTYRDSDKQLWDWRHVTEFPSTSTIRRLARLIKTGTTPPLIAGIVVDQEAHFGLSRMLAILSEQPGVIMRVFRNYEQAQTWLAEIELSAGLYPGQILAATRYAAD